MAATPSTNPIQIMTTPSSKSNQTHFRTPQSRQKLNFNGCKPSPNPNNSAGPKKENHNNLPAEHPVEVIGRIRDYPDQKKNPISSSGLHINPDRQSLRVKTDIGYRDFTLDGVSMSEEEDLEAFYKKFVLSRINGVKLGDKCTIMMYGPTGSGKSHTMFGSSKQCGIVYRSLKDILEDPEARDETKNEKIGVGTFVQVTVMEIYNEEIYDLLSTKDGGGFGLGWPKGSASKVRLEVFGKKAKNANFIAGHEATKISKEIQKVEKRRIVKSTFCNERSSRSHCMIILDVPTVGGRLMLVDMAGSENIEQAGQTGFEAKLQTAKINQGNIALKRVVESIANGDSHVPFRDSKLTMLLQDSFEDDKSKILMILCASPDPKELHKTISTLEYGAKAKCIVRGPHTPIKEKGADDSSCDVILGSRIAAMDQFIYKLQIENKLREKERNEAQKLLQKKEEELSALKGKLSLLEGKGVDLDEDTINSKVNERTQEIRRELEKRIQDCQKMANEFLEMERRKMEEKMLQQQQEFEMLRRRLQEIESELWHSRSDNGSFEVEGSGLVRKMLEAYSDDSGMVKSMDLDKSYDLDAGKCDILVYKPKIGENLTYGAVEDRVNDIEEDLDVSAPNFTNKISLSTVYEEEEEEDDDRAKDSEDEEVQKEVIEEKKICFSTLVDKSSRNNILDGVPFTASPVMEKQVQSVSDRKARIQNIFTLCGNYRELSQHCRTPMPSRKKTDENGDLLHPAFDQSIDLQKCLPKDFSATSGAFEDNQNVTPNQMIVKSSYQKDDEGSKENRKPTQEETDDVNVYVKWEASKDNPGNFITMVKVLKDSTLSDLRKLVEIYLGADYQSFSFLVLGDPSGAPVPRDMEAKTLASKLPLCNNQLNCHLACIRPASSSVQVSHIPFSPLENKLSAKHCDSLSPELPQHLSSTPFITRRRY